MSSFAVADPTVFEGLKCEEASMHSRETYIPCGAPATGIVYHAKDRRAYLMCTPCQDHNVRNRGGRLLTTSEPRGGR